jgi:hypothetical protein
MRLTFHLCAIVFVAVCATWAYRVNYDAQEAQARVERIAAEIAREREAIVILEAEWAYLNRPDRLETLVADYQDELRLVPLVPEQFGEVAMVAYPKIEDQLQNALKAAVSAATEEDR